MPRVILFFSFIGCVTTLSYAQYAEDAPRPFEVYGLASGLKIVDATGTEVVVNPGPSSTFGFTTSGLASGTRAGFVWRHERVRLVADLGFHKYSDRTGSTSLMPLMVGLRFYSDEHYRTSFFGEGLAGAYRWTVRSGNVHFTTGKAMGLVGGGMDIRLTRRLVWRVLNFRSGSPVHGMDPYRQEGHPRGSRIDSGDIEYEEDAVALLREWVTITER